MKISLRSVTTGVLTLAIATAGLALTGGVASAAVNPGWEPDADARGSLTFYDASGNVITGGSLDSSPLVAYAAASGPGRVVGGTPDTKATLFIFTPKLGLLPSQWTASDQLTA